MSDIIALQRFTPRIHCLCRDLVGNLQQNLETTRNTAAAREKVLLDEIERLEGQIRDSSLVSVS